MTSSRIRRALPHIALAALSLLLPACGGAPAVRPLRVAITTSLEDSGLMEDLLPACLAATGLEVVTLAVGSGKAIRLLRNGDVDAALTHEPDLEAALVREGFLALYRPLFVNEFMIVGPPDDPAGVAGAADAAEAMGRIARADRPFVSRGDRSGTHMREQALWLAAGTRPEEERLLETGLGMATTLRVASDKGCYTLTDPATFRRLGDDLGLRILLDGGPRMQNIYSVLVPHPGDDAGSERARRQADALRFAAWLLSEETRARVAAFGGGPTPLFKPVPP